MAEIDPQEFGELKARVDFLIASDEGKTKLLQQLAADMQAVRLQLAEARGGWKLLVALGGASGTVGAALAWAAQHLKVTA